MSDETKDTTALVPSAPETLAPAAAATVEIVPAESVAVELGEIRARLRFALEQLDERTAERDKLQAAAVTSRIALEDAHAAIDTMRGRAEKAESEHAAAMAVVDKDAVTQHPMEVQRAKDAHAAEVDAHAETREALHRGKLRHESLQAQLAATERDRDAHAKRADDAQAALLLAGDARVKRAVDLIATRRAELEATLPRLQMIARGHKPADWTGDFGDTDVHEAARQIPVIIAELDKLG